MTKKEKIKSFDSYKYCQVYVITEYKDNCVYRTQPIGYALVEDTKGLEDIIPADISTKPLEYNEKETKMFFGRMKCFEWTYIDLILLSRSEIIEKRKELIGE